MVSLKERIVMPEVIEYSLSFLLCSMGVAMLACCYAIVFKD